MENVTIQGVKSGKISVVTKGEWNKMVSRGDSQNFTIIHTADNKVVPTDVSEAINKLRRGREVISSEFIIPEGVAQGKE